MSFSSPHTAGTLHEEEANVCVHVPSLVFYAFYNSTKGALSFDRQIERDIYLHIYIYMYISTHVHIHVYISVAKQVKVFALGFYINK